MIFPLASVWRQQPLYVQQRNVTCGGGGVRMKANGKGNDGEELRQYHGFPKDWNNSGIDVFERDEKRFMKDQEKKVLAQKLKESKGWTARGRNEMYIWSTTQYSETDHSF